MMRAAVISAVVCVATAAHAETNEVLWGAKISFSTGASWSTKDLVTPRRIPTWVGSAWRCEVTPAALDNSGRLVGGVSCTVDGKASAVVLASCPLDGSTRDVQTAGIVDTKGHATITVLCAGYQE
jgi:hypothetical protein